MLKYNYKEEQVPIVSFNDTSRLQIGEIKKRMEKSEVYWREIRNCILIGCIWGQFSVEKVS
jgi:hypothetical protein